MTPAPRQSRGKRDLTQGSLTRNLFNLAWPMIVGGVLHNLYSVVDAFWLGKLSREALSAPGVSMPFIFIVVAFGMGFSNAGATLVAQHTGAKQHREADHAAAQTLLLLSGIGLALTAPVILFAPQLLHLFRVPPEVQAESVGYLRIFLIGMPLVGFHMAYGGVLRGLGDTISMVFIVASANLFNLVLDPILIFGWGPVPAMGTEGAAWASVTANVLATVACVALIRRGRAGLRLRWPDFRPCRAMLKQIVHIGLPAAIGMSSNSVGFAVFQMMVNSLGANVIGAFTIGFRITHFLSIPGHCMSAAAGPVVGQALGAGDRALARRAVRVSVALVAGGMLLPYLIVIWQGHWVARAFSEDAGVIAEATRFFRVVPFSTYSFMVLMVLMSAFMGSGHTRPMMMLSILRQWFLRLPVGYFLGFILKMGSTGVYLGLVAGNVVCAVIAVWLFMSGGWEKAVINRTAPDTDDASADEAT